MLKDVLASVIAVVALIVVGVLALRGQDAAAGAFITTLAASVGWYLRGKVAEPNA